MTVTMGTDLDKELRNAAIAWWKNHRPLAWDKALHLKNPTINTLNNAERRLARIVAKIVERDGR